MDSKKTEGSDSFTWFRRHCGTSWRAGRFLVSLTIGIASLHAGAAEPKLSPDAPKDKPFLSTSTEQLERTHKATEPYVNEARKTYPEAKARFLKGLPRGESFFLTTRLHDSERREEQVFVAVKSIKDGIVSGMIYSRIQVVSGFTYRQPYTFPETELVDWLISKPDGSEEGNVVGKFLDTYDGR